MENDRAKNLDLLDTSQRPAYLLTMIQQWLTLVLNFVVALIALVLTSLATQPRSNSGFTGASLVTLMGFGDALVSIVVFYTLLETSIEAIGRLRSFDETVKTEDRDEENIIPPPEWPQRGEIALKGTSASYDEDEEKAEPSLALKQIHLSIQPGEKLLEPSPQTPDAVYIDGTASLHRIDRSALRQRIICIPQDADARLVLEAVGLLLLPFVAERGGLDAGMTARGAAAALLARPRAQPLGAWRGRIRGRRPAARRGELGGGPRDGEGDAGGDRIGAEFREYTVLAVSHHLDRIMGFDRIVVMDKGEVVEVGSPVVLAQDSATRFGELCRFRGK
ncbi:P-loop containing nucleoside triphosphate hydrolase protein [Biscogniauxia mediterranea]|nr:P-loop containing nucleoside triphosphate hydrolase protein [Biscogniauxia mediterranea]